MLKHFQPEMHYNPLNVRCVRTTRVCGVMVTLLGILGIWAKVSGNLIWSGFRAKYTSMSPHLAAYLIVFGLALLLTQTRWVTWRRCAIPFCILIAVLGAYDLVPLLFGVKAVPASIPLGNTDYDIRPFVRISRISGAGLILCGFALVLLLRKGLRFKAVVPYVASFVLIGGCVVLLGYLYGTPLLYGGRRNSPLGPVALSTALAFVSLSIGLIAATGPDYHPLRAVTGPSASSQMLRAFLPVTFVIVLVDECLSHWVRGYATLNPAVRDAFQALVSAMFVTLVVFLVARRIGRRQEQAEDALRQANEELESRVRARTSELELANSGLRQSEERFRQLAENIREVLWMTDLTKQQMLYVSPGYETIWGRSCQSLYERPQDWVDALHPEDKERTSRAAFEKQDVGEYNQIYRILRPDGTMRWIRDRAFPVKDQDGKPYRIVGLAEDITEEKELDEKLAALGHAVESSAEPISISDNDNRVIFVNHAFELATGYTRDEILGKHASILHSKRNPPGLAETIVEQTRKGGWIGEVWDIRKDGSEFPIFLSTSEVKKSNGEVMGFMGIGRDMTERYRAEAILRESEERFRSLFQSAPIGIALHDVDGRYLQINSAYEKISGYKERELQAFGSSAAITHSDDVVSERQMFEALIQGHVDTYRNEIRYVRKDRSVVTTMLTTSALRGGDGKIRYVISMIENITEQKNLERQMLEIAALERQRIGHELHDGLGQFLAGVAFKVKALEVALDGSNGVIPTDRKNEVKLLSGLMREALSQTRRLAHGLQPIELEGRGVLSALTTLAEMSENMFDVDCDFACDQTQLPIRPEAALALYRIAQEAIHNAVNHGSAKKIRVELAVRGGDLNFTISDDGSGFRLPPTHTVANDSSHMLTGGGMGLRIMEYRARAAGGQFEIKPNAPRGTNIICTFPRTAVLPEHWRD
jgi:PAS domain S-box-containing protein